MRKQFGSWLIAAGLVVAGAIGYAWAQAYTMPPPAGIVTLGCTFQAAPPTLTNGQTGAVQCNNFGQMYANGIGQNGNTPIQPYPNTATPITANNTGTTAAVTATLANTAGKTTYICGYQIAANATAAVSGVTANIANLVTAGITFLQAVAASPAVATTQQTFTPCIPANAANTAITIQSIAAGTGGNTTVYAWGFQF